MNLPTLICRDCGHHCPDNSWIEGLCFQGSEDSGPDSILSEDPVCKGFDPRPFQQLHPGVSSKRWEQI